MGTEGVGGQQFTRELYAGPRAPMEVPNVNNKDLEIFVRDLPFNFAVEQALESLDDLGALAEVARLQTLVVRVPVYANIA
jgi:hypothetical protein